MRNPLVLLGTLALTALVGDGSVAYGDCASAAGDATVQKVLPDAAAHGVRRCVRTGKLSGDNHCAAPKTAPVQLLVRLGGVVEAEHLGLHVDGAGSGELEDLEQF